MTITRLRIRNKSYVVTNHADGTQTFEPPLPESMVKVFEGRKGEVIKSGQCPSIRGDTTFHAGRMSFLDQFKGDRAYLRKFQKEYKKKTGVSMPTEGVYLGQLAEGRFDPSAVIGPSGGQADVDRLIRRKAEKNHRKASEAPIRLAADIVDRKVRDARREGDKTPAKELRHTIIEKHGRPV